MDYVCTVAWSPNGQWIASGAGDGTVQIWNSSTGERVFTYLGHTAPVRALAWSSDSRQLVSGGEDRTAHVWEARDGTRRLAYHGHTDDIDALAWSPDGKRIASASTDRTVQIWDATTGVHHLTYWGHEKYDPDALMLDVLSWSPNGFYLASGGEDATVQIWDTATGKQLALLREKNLVTSVLWLQNGAQLLCAGQTHVRIYDALTSTLLRTPPFLRMPSFTVPCPHQMGVSSPLAREIMSYESGRRGQEKPSSPTVDTVMLSRTWPGHQMVGGLPQFPGENFSSGKRCQVTLALMARSRFSRTSNEGLRIPGFPDQPAKDPLHGCPDLLPFYG
jgi:WD40 repeat protein